MAMRAHEHMEQLEDMDEDDDRDEELEQLLVCLDMLRGSSALLRHHKAGLAGLLPSRGWKARRALERLVADLTDVLSATGSTTAAGSQQQPPEGAGARPAAGRRGGGLKRARGAQAMQPRSAKQQQEEEEEQGAAASYSSSASSLCVRADPLGLAEVVEHIMSFAEGREMLARLSRVCRLWKRVSEGEGLCLPMVQEHMPCALLGEEESLHAKLGGSARRCLQVHNASLTPGRLLCNPWERLWSDLWLLAELRWNSKLLSAMQGPLMQSDDGVKNLLRLSVEGAEEGRPAVGCVMHQVPFSAASLGSNRIDDVFRSGLLDVGVYVMDKVRGVVACLWRGAFEGEGPDVYTTSRMPVTSISYAGPPLHGELDVEIEPVEHEGEEEAADVDLVPDAERLWVVTGGPYLQFTGQPAIYAKKFIRTRLAEEAAAAVQSSSNSRQ